jgi:hypothetical protein
MHLAFAPRGATAWHKGTDMKRTTKRTGLGMILDFSFVCAFHFPLTREICSITPLPCSRGNLGVVSLGNPVHKYDDKMQVPPLVLFMSTPAFPLSTTDGGRSKQEKKQGGG